MNKTPPRDPKECFETYFQNRPEVFIQCCKDLLASYEGKSLPRGENTLHGYIMYLKEEGYPVGGLFRLAAHQVTSEAVRRCVELHVTPP